MRLDLFSNRLEIDNRSGPYIHRLSFKAAVWAKSVVAVSIVSEIDHRCVVIPRQAHCCHALYRRIQRYLSCSIVLLLLLPSPLAALAQPVQNVSPPSVRVGDVPSTNHASRTTKQFRADTTGILIVRMVGLNTNKGSVQIALTDAEGYENDDDLREGTLPVTNNGAHWTIEAVSFETYAV